MVQYGRQLFRDRATLADYTAAILGVTTTYRLRGHVQQAWDVVRCWNDVGPSELTVPCPEIVMKSVVVVSLLFGWDVFARYAFGGLEDDAAVAQVHAPAEFGYTAFTEAMVTVDATLDAALAASAIAPGEHALIRDKANAVFFKDRSWAYIFDVLASDIVHAAERLKPFIRNVKRQDAQALLKVLLEGKHPDEAKKSGAPLTGWLFNETTQWQKLRAQH